MSIIFLVVVIKCLEYSYLSSFFYAHHVSGSSVTNQFYSIVCTRISHAIAMVDMSKCCKNIQLIIKYNIFYIVRMLVYRLLTHVILFAILYILSCSFLSLPFLYFFFTRLDVKPIKRRNQPSIPLLFSSVCTHAHILNT